MSTAVSPPPAAPSPARWRGPRWLRRPSFGNPALWWADAATLAVAMVAMGIALLAPRLLPDTDPFGVDPYSLRLAAVTLTLLAVAALAPSARAALPVLVGIAAVVLPFVLWTAVLNLLADTVHASFEYRRGELLREVVYLVATLAVAGAALRLARRAQERPPRLRLLSFRPTAMAVTLLLVTGMAVVTLAIPAMVLGRVALPLAQLSADLPLLGPAFALQGAAQELAFRGVLLGTLERHMPPWMANTGQALFFGLAHIAILYEGPSVSIVPVTIGLGLALGWVTQKTGSIWPAVVTHAVIEVGQAYLVTPGLYGY